MFYFKNFARALTLLFVFLFICQANSAFGIITGKLVPDEKAVKILTDLKKALNKEVYEELIKVSKFEPEIEEYLESFENLPLNFAEDFFNTALFQNIKHPASFPFLVKYYYNFMFANKWNDMKLSDQEKVLEGIKEYGIIPNYIVLSSEGEILGPILNRLISEAMDKIEYQYSRIHDKQSAINLELSVKDDLGRADLLIDLGYDVNLPGIYGDTALLKVLRQLQEFNKQNYFYHTEFGVGIYNELKKIFFKLLSAGADPAINDRGGNNVLNSIFDFYPDIWSEFWDKWLRFKKERRDLIHKFVVPSRSVIGIPEITKIIEEYL